MQCAADLALLIRDVLPELLSTTKADDQALHPWLITIDNIENAGEEGPPLLTKLRTLTDSQQDVRFLLLGDCGTVKRWSLPTGVNLYDLLPLLQAQRKQALCTLSFPHGSAIGLGTAAKMPVFFSLAIETGHEAEKVEDLIESWLDVTLGNGSQERDTLATRSFDILRDSSQADHEHIPTSFFQLRAIQQVLAARHLMNSPWHTAVELFDKDPSRWEGTLISLLTRTAQFNRQGELIEELLHETIINKQLAVLLVSQFIDEASEYQQECVDQSLSIIQSNAPFVVREKAGRVLSRLGDPRDLTTLAQVPKGTTVHGSNSHPNSEPLAELTIQGFRIGKYPVVNQHYALFVKETGRLWQSPDMDKKERRNSPATDLTWHDANAYCAWLTSRWRADGKINSDEEVRLPTEPEWERAALGDRKQQDGADLIWPWGSEWREDCSNYDNLGLNSTCSVGLFPNGRSQFGCYDMAGQIWEWCSTNWGDNMTTPTFKYPWKNDERENRNENGTIRRVLRGGCFSSANFKITGTYRGSLEPGGFWRGNGFRVVVASV